jgi:hypothetical protein
MTTSAGKDLPPEALAMLSGDDPRGQLGKIIPLVTVDGEGFPHVALLSPGEVLAVESQALRLALYEKGTTLRNIKDRSKLTLILVEPGLCCYAKGLGTVTDVTIPPGPVQPFTAVRVNVEVEEVLLDHETGASVSAGSRYERDVPESDEIAYWARVWAGLRSG